VCCDRFRLPSALQQEKLRKNSDCFKEDGERPKNLCRYELVVEDAAKNKTWTKEVFNAKRVDGRIMCRSDNGGVSTKKQVTG